MWFIHASGVTYSYVWHTHYVLFQGEARAMAEVHLEQIQNAHHEQESVWEQQLAEVRV